MKVEVSCDGAPPDLDEPLVQVLVILVVGLV